MGLPPLIAVDWGTSSLRGARLDAAGQVIEEKSAPLGILNVPNGDFAGVFAALTVTWRDNVAPPVLVGQVEPITAYVTSPKSGTVAQLNPNRLQQVTGQRNGRRVRGKSVLERS